MDMYVSMYVYYDCMQYNVMLYIDRMHAWHAWDSEFHPRLYTPKKSSDDGFFQGRLG